MKELPFSRKELEAARSCIKQGGVKSILFSEGTYQVEVEESGSSFWPFLQVSDQGELLDAFCTCSDEKEGHCIHEAAGYLCVMAEDDEPLHVRFRSCLWNQLCLMASRRHGYRVDCLEKRAEYQAKSLTGKLLFSMEPLNEEGVKKMDELIENRPVETEETSLKFSNLEAEEIQLWKQGRPSEKLKYELSFWSDLAKWWMSMQHLGHSYSIEFFPKEKELPKWIRIRFDSIAIGFYISKPNWAQIIPALRSVNSPLFVQESAERHIESIEYNPKKKELHFKFLEGDLGKQKQKSPEEIEVDGWRYVPGEGFFSAEEDSLEKRSIIEEKQLGEFLLQHTSLLRRYLKEPIFEGSYPVHYHLSFDTSQSLHIEMFLFEKGDLLQKEAAFLGSFAYLPGKGFYPLEPQQFSRVKTVIAADDVSDFVSRHKVWLSRFEGFQIHLMTVEPELSYEVDLASYLVFSSRMELTEDLQDVIDFGEWVFVAGKGFLPKRKERMISTIKAGKKVAPEEIPSFLRQYKEELLLVPHFFSEKSPVAEFSLEVTVTGEDSLHVKPIYFLLPEYQKKRVLFFGEYVYVESEGFARFLPSNPLLEEYVIEKDLTYKEEMNFLSRLSVLQPWISNMDPKLQTPKKLSMGLHAMQQKQRAGQNGWMLGLSYKTELGLVDLYEVWKAIQTHRSFLYSQAGLIDLSSDRFKWLKNISKRQWGPGKKTVFLTTIDWIRLQMLEEISLPKDKEVARVFEEFHSYQSSMPLSTEGLQSHLRPYQETGLKWLWFLYSYGLSGLLCDEMGLGKTHQAMALLAAIANANSEKKQYLIVCPTSVIYHWEDLLCRFLPRLKVYVFYGQARQLEDFAKEECDILLTSYGIVRSEKKQLSLLGFHVAIFDEIQNAKNAHSQTHRALASLKAAVKIGLTGTPIENNIMELKALFDLILPHYLPSDAAFKEHFLLPIEKEQNENKRKELTKIVKPFILRRKKTEVLKELPEKIEEISYCDLSLEQKNLYRQLFFAEKETILHDLKAPSEGRVVMHVFSLLSKLKQVCDHPCLITKDKENFLKHSSGKWDLFIELLEEARSSRQKIVVFTQYLDMMDLIEAYLDLKGIGYAEIRGSTRDRKEALLKFKEDPNCEVFVASLQAAGVGIDLTAASIVIHYDRWWNPAKEDQATDRVHRMGQSRGVQVFKLVTKKSVEEKIHELILKKKGILDEVIGFDEQDVIKKLTKQELVDLFTALGQDLQEE
jgi:superfamily II DNA or RNA helicase